MNNLLNEDKSSYFYLKIFKNLNKTINAKEIDLIHKFPYLPIYPGTIHNFKKISFRKKGCEGGGQVSPI